MFAFTKLQKQKKLLVNLTKSYNDVKSDLRHYLDDNSDDPDLAQAKISKFQLEMLRIATIYDELKEQYPDFNVLRINDHWKLSKPEQSEGTVFKFDPDNTKLHRNYMKKYVHAFFTRNMSHIYNDHIKRSHRIEQRPLKRYLRLAMGYKEDQSYNKQCQDVMEFFHISNYDPNDLEVAATFLDHISTTTKKRQVYQISLPVSLKIQKQIAKIAKQNLLL